jgi:hypothetical protein
MLYYYSVLCFYSVLSCATMYFLCYSVRLCVYLRFLLLLCDFLRCSVLSFITMCLCFLVQVTSFFMLCRYSEYPGFFKRHFRRFSIVPQSWIVCTFPFRSQLRFVPGFLKRHFPRFSIVPQSWIVYILSRFVPSSLFIFKCTISVPVLFSLNSWPICC